MAKSIFDSTCYHEATKRDIYLLSFNRTYIRLTFDFSNFIERENHDINKLDYKRKVRRNLIYLKTDFLQHSINEDAIQVIGKPCVYTASRSIYVV